MWRFFGDAKTQRNPLSIGIDLTAIDYTDDNFLNIFLKINYHQNIPRDELVLHFHLTLTPVMYWLTLFQKNQMKNEAESSSVAILQT